LQHSDRTVKKEEFIQALINNTDNKTKEQLAEDMGISKSQFYRYQKEYTLSSKEEVRKIAQSLMPEVLVNLRKSAASGSDRANQLIAEMAEMYTPSNKMDIKGTMQVMYQVGLVRTPMDAGLSPDKQVKSNEQRQLKQRNSEQTNALEKHQTSEQT